MRYLYEIYSRSFPEYPVTEELFFGLLCPEKAQIITEESKGVPVGYAMVHGSSVTLLCVDAEHRGQGIGNKLLNKAEVHIKSQGYDQVILGQGKYYLLQGVPETHENIAFFKKRGYDADWSSVNMSLNLGEFSADTLDIPAPPEDVEFRMMNHDDMPQLLMAVEDAHSAWKDVYITCKDSVFVAVRNGRIVGFQILAPDGGRFAGKSEKVGAIGCVGVIHSERQKGIGLRMVAEGARWLKAQGCSSIELRYVELVKWYEKVGFRVIRHQWMGRKSCEEVV